MQKVEGSSPFIRSSETRWKRRVLCFQNGGRSGEIGVRVSSWVSSFRQCRRNTGQSAT